MYCFQCSVAPQHKLIVNEEITAPLVTAPSTTYLEMSTIGTDGYVNIYLESEIDKL